MKTYPKISIVTVNYNKGKYIEETIQSVLNQGYPNLEYIIIDGGSTDNSVAIIRKYESQLAHWVSEKDSGMYDALQKGFSRSSGDIMGWLNSDDILHPKALFTIGEIFGCLPVEWIQGLPTVIDDFGKVVYTRAARNRAADFYNKKYHDGIFIQQESTYWRRSLWEKAGSHISTDYKYAGDFELWMRFFQSSKLYNIQVIIGAFRFSESEQLSKNNYEKYLQESDSIVEKYNKATTGKTGSVGAEKKRKLFSFNRRNQLPDPRIEYDFQKRQFYLPIV